MLNHLSFHFRSPPPQFLAPGPTSTLRPDPVPLRAGRHTVPPGDILFLNVPAPGHAGPLVSLVRPPAWILASGGGTVEDILRLLPRLADSVFKSNAR